jgi:PPOX class probable F420-dependent enzyme
VKLTSEICAVLLRGAEHGTLATLHPLRGVDAVPACFAYDGANVAVPVDRVKPKSGPVLQRVRNLDADPRAVLLVDRWSDNDWSRLWWVRASLERLVAGPPGLRDGLEELLELKYRQYEGRPFADVILFRVTRLEGWAASPEAIDG